MPRNSFATRAGSVVLTYSLAALMAACTQNDQKAVPAATAAGEQVAQESAVKAYVWGYPLVISAATALVATNADKPMPNAHAPVNSFGHVAKLFTAADTDVVSSNVDTVYSSAIVDLKQGAALVSVPDSKGRYYALMLEDAYTNIFGYVGKRATGSKAGKYLLVGPGWKGTPPAGIQVISAPTSFVWIIGRTLVDNQADLVNVKALQSGYGLEMVPPVTDATPMKERWGLTSDLTQPPAKTADGLDWKTYYHWLGQLMKDNPPPAADDALLAQFAAIGLSVERGFEPDKLSPATLAALEKGYVDGKAKVVKDSMSSGATEVNGWAYNLNAGKWGQDYDLRAGIAYRSLGQNTAEEALYFNSRQDADKATLNGANNYTLTFPKGQTPPVDAFWSVTMYNAENFFVANPIGRLAIGNRTPGLVTDADGSLTIFVQKSDPGGKKTANWLPAPDGDFRLSLRLYNPRPDVLAGKWLPPATVKVKS